MMNSGSLAAPYENKAIEHFKFLLFGACSGMTYFPGSRLAFYEVFGINGFQSGDFLLLLFREHVIHSD
jgi:hypothetical protein